MAEPTMSELMRARAFGRPVPEATQEPAATKPTGDVDADKGVGPEVKVEHVGGEVMRVFSKEELNPRSES